MTLITRERAQRNISQSSFSAADSKLIDALIASASSAVEQYCRRGFAARQHDELYHGHGGRLLVLRHYPIVQVERVAGSPTTVLTISNASSTNQRATVAVSDTGLTLTRVASGTTSTDATITFAANATLSAVASAISALANGWSATAVTDYANWASADLRAIQGAFNAKNANAELKVHVEDLSTYDVDAERGILHHTGYASTLWPDDCSRGGWARGTHNYRVVYTAGYRPVPEDVQEACAEWVAMLYWQAKRDPGLAAESMPAAGARTPLTLPMPASTHLLLGPYRRQDL